MSFAGEAGKDAEAPGAEEPPRLSLFISTGKVTIWRSFEALSCPVADNPRRAACGLQPMRCSVRGAAYGVQPIAAYEVQTMRCGLRCAAYEVQRGLPTAILEINLGR